MQCFAWICGGSEPSPAEAAPEPKEPTAAQKPKEPKEPTEAAPEPKEPTAAPLDSHLRYQTLRHPRQARTTSGPWRPPTPSDDPHAGLWSDAREDPDPSVPPHVRDERRAAEERATNV